MQNNTATYQIPTQTRQLREELPGPWYNYEPDEITLDLQEFNHWLNRLDQQLKEPPSN